MRVTRRCAATRLPSKKISTVWAVIRTSTGLPGQGEGDAVEPVPDLDVVVDVDGGPAPLGVLVALSRKWPQRRTVHLLEPAAAIPVELLEGPVVDHVDSPLDLSSELIEREEGVVAQRRHDLTLNDLHSGLRLRLVGGPSRPRREHSRPVMGGQLLICAGQARLVAARLLHGRLLVVGDHELRHATEKFEHPDMRHRPVRKRPAPRHVHEGVVRRSQDADEDHHVACLSGVPVHDLEPGTGIVHEDLLTAPVAVAQHDINPCAPPLVALTEPAVAVSVRVGLEVLQPEKAQRRALVALQLPVDVLPIGFGTGDPRRGPGREECRLQRGVVQLLGQWPRQTGRRRTPHVLADRASADAQHRGYLPVAAPEPELEAQDFSSVRHGQPLLSHLLPPLLEGPLRGRKKWPLSMAIQHHYPLIQASGMLRNRCPACSGIGVRHAPESMSGMLRNPHTEQEKCLAQPASGPGPWGARCVWGARPRLRRRAAGTGGEVETLISGLRGDPKTGAPGPLAQRMLESMEAEG